MLMTTGPSVLPKTNIRTIKNFADKKKIGGVPFVL